MKKFLSIPAGLSMVIAAVMLHQPAQARTRSCTYFREVSTHQRLIRKVITLNNTNANTDFAVPTGTHFNSYIAQAIPENNSHYGIEVNLKYNDGSSAKAVSRSIEAKRFYHYDQSFRTPTNRQPYQINTRITGDRNTAYQVSVFGCQ